MISRDQRVVVRTWTFDKFYNAVQRQVVKWGGSERAIKRSVVLRCYHRLMRVTATAAKFVK